MFTDDILIALAVWTICAVVAWWIATTKKAPDAGTWAVWGLLFGPFGVLAAIAFAKPASPERAGRICASCGKVVAADRDRLCDNCGLPFAPTT